MCPWRSNASRSASPSPRPAPPLPGAEAPWSRSGAAFGFFFFFSAWGAPPPPVSLPTLCSTSCRLADLCQCALWAHASSRRGSRHYGRVTSRSRSTSSAKGARSDASISGDSPIPPPSSLIRNVAMRPPPCSPQLHGGWSLLTRQYGTRLCHTLVTSSPAGHAKRGGPATAKHTVRDPPEAVTSGRAGLIQASGDALALATVTRVMETRKKRRRAVLTPIA
jgi:hypothetical protein